MYRNPTDLAYFAGYMDGDGCFHIREQQRPKGTKFSSAIIINSVNEATVQWMVSCIGGRVQRTNTQKAHHKPIYRYQISSPGIETIGFHPFLVQKKKEFETFEKFRKETDRSRRRLLIEEMKFLKKSEGLIDKSLKEEIECLRNTITPSQEDLAYLAGFIDAECCLGIQRNFPKERPNPTYKIQLQLNDTKYPCLFWISSRFGGQFHFVDRSRFATPHRNQMCWRLSAAQLYPLLPKIHPFLKHKKPVCEALIKFYETTFLRKGSPSPNSEKFEEFYKPILEERARIFNHVSQLNKKGV